VKAPPGVSVSQYFPKGVRCESLQAPGISQIAEWLVDLKSKYEQVEPAGKRGQVELWKNIETHEEIAVKTFLLDDKDKKAGLEAQNKFLSELQNLLPLRHPCILSLKGCCLPNESSDGLRLVTEFCRSGSLRPILSSQTKTPRWWTQQKKITAIAGIVLGMKYLHSEGFIHRDLKPDSILLDEDGRVRITDFGLSQILESVLVKKPAESHCYVAPELKTGTYDEKVDVYSFGLMLYEICTGDAFLSDLKPGADVLVKLESGWRPEIASCLPDVTKRLIKRCWAANCSERPSFAEIWDILKGCEFEVIKDVKGADVRSFVKWVEDEIEEGKK
jgi:serine/threonine protein kinase